MSEMTALQPGKIGGVELKNRIVRSATYEGRCDHSGIPDRGYGDLYAGLARNEVGAMITGFAFVSKAGRAMQPRQAGIENESKIPFYQEITSQVHRFDGRIFVQLAHAGRQTSPRATGEEVLGVSRKKSGYFGSSPRSIGTGEALQIAEQFADAAVFAMRAGFDGVQLHAAHGYLIHQFLSPAVNDRKDAFGIDQRSQLGTRFLELIMDRTRQKCGSHFPILVKISGGDDEPRVFSEERFINLVRFLGAKGAAAIEISYGTMERPLNIFRGNTVPLEEILRYNPRYGTSRTTGRSLWKRLAARLVLSRVKPFTPTYNLPYAELAKKYSDIPIISVGGFRSGTEIESALNGGKADFISLCRPFLREPDFARRLKADGNYVSKCVSCNVCAVLCDTQNPTKCHMEEVIHEY
jgi:2,4-dienoyl-CoA reductase-like NADH-dependent reductase (Old Yellow Enzyme family)